MEQTGDNRCAVETVMNHRHILDIFPSNEARPSRIQVVYLDRLLAEMWMAKLLKDFPERRFVVSFPESEFDDLLDYEITVYQDQPED